SLLIFLILALLLSTANSLALYVDWLWFAEVGYQQVFLTLLSTQVMVGAAFGLTFFLVLFSNLVIAASHEPARYCRTMASPLLLRFAAPFRANLWRPERSLLLV